MAHRGPRTNYEDYYDPIRFMQPMDVLRLVPKENMRLNNLEQQLRRFSQTLNYTLRFLRHGDSVYVVRLA